MACCSSLAMKWDSANLSSKPSAVPIEAPTRPLMVTRKRRQLERKASALKACYKVASQVWIRSGNYSFMFDRKKTSLVMITPIWTPFPDFPEEHSATTMFAIKIEKGHHIDAVNDQLQELSPSVLMFLHRLTKVSVIHSDEQYNITSHIVLECQKSRDGDLQIATTTRATASCSHSSRYFLSDYTVKDMPAEEKRPGVGESLVVLAFQCHDDYTPVLDDQEVHAFLPICTSGFPFLTQADFLLVSSRQDIDTSLSWNRRLRDRLVFALVEAFKRMNNTDLRYKWPKFVPRTRHGRHKYLSYIVEPLLKHLKGEQVLEEWNGNNMAPSALCFLPGEFLHDEGQPLIMAGNYLSPRYDPADLLGIVSESFSAAQFIDMFKISAKKRDSFYSMPKSFWMRWGSTLRQLIWLY